jgi:hypothetical protein
LIKESRGNTELDSKSEWTCPYSPDIENKISIKEIICKGCGIIFKTNANSNYCIECKKIFYDEP